MIPNTIKQKIPKNKHNPLGAFGESFRRNTKDDANFILWFIGFMEAEGSFTITSRRRGDIHFVITQGYRNISILYYLKAFFGFGRVIKQGTQTFRYVVQDYPDLLNIIHLLNGKIVLQKIKLKFKLFIEAFNKYYGTNILFINNEIVPTLNDAWLSGFIDGDGSFGIYYNKITKCFFIIFSCAQIEDLSFLKNIFNQGSCTFSSANKSFHFRIKQTLSFKSDKKKETNFNQVIQYFQKFTLRTTKLNSYSLWFYIHNQLLHTKVTPEKKASLQVLCKLINIANDSEAKNLWMETQEKV